MQARRRILLALVGAVALAGCGSGSSKTSSTATTGAQKLPIVAQATLQAKGDSICSTFKSQKAAIQAPSFLSNPTTAQLPEVATYYAKVLPVYETEVFHLRALGRSSTNDAAYEATLGNEESLIAAFTAAREEATAKQLRAYQGALSLARRFVTQAKTAASSFGFKICATTS